MNYVISTFLVISLMACAKGKFEATATELPPVSKLFSADANRTYYAVRWALDAADYPLASEDLNGGVLTTSWVATKSDSHYVRIFDRKDFGVTGAYYRLKVQLVPEDGKTRVDITPIVKSVVTNMESTGYEERRIFRKVGDFLHSDDITLTNIGIDEEK